MGIFNYASFFREKDLHTAFDVNTYEDWGNTVNDPAPEKDSWNANVVGKDKEAYPADKSDSNHEKL